jgi:amino acid transporter
VSATQVATFITAAVLAVLLAALAVLMVWKLKPTEERTAPGWFACGLLILGLVIFSVGAGIASDNPNDPAAVSTPHGCQPGTYDTASNGDGPKCLPWPAGTYR